MTAGASQSAVLVQPRPAEWGGSVKPRRLPTSHTLAQTQPRAWGYSLNSELKLYRQTAGWEKGPRPEVQTPAPGRPALAVPAPTSALFPGQRQQLGAHARHRLSLPERSSQGPGVRLCSHASAGAWRRQGRLRPRPLAPANCRPRRPGGGGTHQGGGGSTGRRRRWPRPLEGRGRRRLLRQSWAAAWERAGRSRPRRRPSCASPGPGREGGRRQTGRSLRHARHSWLRPGCAPRRLHRDEAPLRGDDLRERHGRDHWRGKREQLLGVSAGSARAARSPRRRGALCRSRSLEVSRLFSAAS